jgi:hypothetical protein
VKFTVLLTEGLGFTPELLQAVREIRIRQQYTNSLKAGILSYNFALTLYIYG